MKFSIQNKITISFVLILACMLSAIFIYFNKNLKDFTYKRIQENLTRQLELAKKYSYISIKDLPLTVSYVDKVADEIGQTLKARVSIIRSDGKVLGDSYLTPTQIKELSSHLARPEMKAALSGKLGESHRYSQTLEKDMLYQAIYCKKKNCIIRLALPLSDILLLTKRLQKVLFFSLVIAFIFSLIISLIVSSFITIPLKRMVKISQSIANGHYNRKILINNKDEVGELAQSMENMALEIKQKIDDVQSSNSRLEAVLLSMFNGILVLDKDGNIILINDALKDIFRLNIDWYGKKVIEVIRNIDIKELADSVLNKQKGIESKEMTILTPDVKEILVHATPILINNQPEGAVLIFHDITKLKRLEKMKKDFVANVSHEMRTPITSIRGYAETLLDEGWEENKNTKKFLEIIHDSAISLTALSQDLLALAKIESNQFQLDLNAINIRKVINKVVSLIAIQAENKKIEIVNNVPNNLPKVELDEEKIGEVLLNLIDNALMYNVKNGKVFLNAKIKEDTLVVEVKDLGIGIPQKDLTRIFERFYRVDKGRSRAEGGTGLGLAIVKHIIQAHRGQISVESELGRGTIFSFNIPIKKT